MPGPLLAVGGGVGVKRGSVGVWGGERQSCWEKDCLELSWEGKCRAVSHSSYLLIHFMHLFTLNFLWLPTLPTTPLSQVVLPGATHLPFTHSSSWIFKTHPTPTLGHSFTFTFSWETVSKNSQKYQKKNMKWKMI